MREHRRTLISTGSAPGREVFCSYGRLHALKSYSHQQLIVISTYKFGLFSFEFMKMLAFCLHRSVLRFEIREP